MQTIATFGMFDEFMDFFPGVLFGGNEPLGLKSTLGWANSGTLFGGFRLGIPNSPVWRLGGFQPIPLQLASLAQNLSSWRVRDTPNHKWVQTPFQFLKHGSG